MQWKNVNCCGGYVTKTFFDMAREQGTAALFYQGSRFTSPPPVRPCNGSEGPIPDVDCTEWSPVQNASLRNCGASTNGASMLNSEIPIAYSDVEAGDGKVAERLLLDVEAPCPEASFFW
jgi:hypothetical protein